MPARAVLLDTARDDSHIGPHGSGGMNGSDITRREALKRAAWLLGGMTSSACQNPSITYMALTARVADFAVRELQRRNL